MSSPRNLLMLIATGLAASMVDIGQPPPRGLVSPKVRDPIAEGEKTHAAEAKRQRRMAKRRGNR